MLYYPQTPDSDKDAGMLHEPAQGAIALPRGRQREIAAHAGVSVSTVSRVLNNVSGISEELQQRVRSSAQALGYTLAEAPPGRLQSITLIGGSTVSVGLNSESFYMGLISGVEAECRRHDIELRYTLTQPGPGGAALVRSKLSPGDGLLFLAVDDVELIAQLRDSGGPVALLNTDAPDLEMDTFLPDNWQAPLKAVRYLISCGHRRILHLTTDERSTIHRRRLAYQAALEGAGIAYDPDLVLVASGEYAEVLRARLASRRDFTAIFCSNDSIAIAAVHTLQEAGLRVPEDVSVVGFDDIGLAALIDPALTTIRIEREELAGLAVRRLIERAATPTLAPVRVELGCRLIERESVARLAAQGDEPLKPR